MGKHVWSQAPIIGTLAAGATALTDKINLDNQEEMDGFFALQVEITGDGTLKIEALLCLVKPANGEVPTDAQFLKPSGASDIVTAFTKASGSDGNGKDIFQHPLSGEPGLAGWIRYRLTETGAADEVVYTIYDKMR